MSYKTVLVHVDESRHAAERIRIAAQIAIAENAHLIGAAFTGISRFAHESSAQQPDDPTLDNPNVAIHRKQMQERANRALEEFESIAKKLGALAIEKRLVDDEAGAGISMQANYADLVVIGQIDPREPLPSVMPYFPEYVVMHCGHPVLLVPYSGHFETVGKNVLLAWDASTAASRAISNAIPLLRQANIVQVAVFNPDLSSDQYGQQPGADIALYLARHNINVEVAQQVSDVDIGNALLSLASDMNSDLIVMGAYVHSRFRELLLGGVTKLVLETMTVPVLMSH